MPLYGSTDEVKQMLRPTAASELGSDADDRLMRLQKAISLVIEDKLGRTFGAPVADTTVTVYAGPYNSLILPTAARAITSVVVGGNIAGGTVTNGTTYADTQYAYDPVDDDGRILGLRLLSGGWWGGADYLGNPLTPVLVTGDFTDTDDDGDVPDDISEAANFLIAETFKYQNASPAGFVGPDGATVPIRDPWKDPLVMAAMDRWRMPRRRMVV